MTEKVVTPTYPKSGFTNVDIISWAALDGDDSGAAMGMSKFADKTVHFFGTWGGASVTLYGSNDPKALVDLAAGTTFANKTASWVALTDAQGNAITKTADSIEVIEENPLYILPVITGGSGSTINVVICGKRTP